MGTHSVEKFDADRFYLVIRKNAANELREKYVDKRVSEREIRNLALSMLTSNDIMVVHTIMKNSGLLIVYRCYCNELQRYMDLSVVLTTNKAPDGKMDVAFLTMVRTPEETNKNRVDGRLRKTRENQL